MSEESRFGQGPEEGNNSERFDDLERQKVILETLKYLRNETKRHPFATSVEKPKHGIPPYDSTWQGGVKGHPEAATYPAVDVTCYKRPGHLLGTVSFYSNPDNGSVLTEERYGFWTHGEGARISRTVGKIETEPGTPFMQVHQTLEREGAISLDDCHGLRQRVEEALYPDE